ncbi:MAG: tyrosine-type recombinase/integrase [bacterium]|nr:tyrosine-type recombinase/integrase [bacterium]
MTRLRQKMLEDLRLRDLGDRTRKTYICSVAAFARFHGRSPELLGTAEVRRFLLHLANLKRAPATRVVYHAALTFLFVHTLGRPEVMALVPRPRVRTQRPSRALTRSEARALLAAMAGRPFDYTFFALMLATGLRISEAAALRVHDIDRRAGLIRVRSGKGDKARSVMLSPRTLRLLERYWRVVRPPEPLLFPARRLCNPGRVDPVRPWAAHPVSTSTMSARLRRLQPAGSCRITSHDMRRSFGTWLLEEGSDLRLVQVLLGHASPQTTARYTCINADLIARTPSPYDQL